MNKVAYITSKAIERLKANVTYWLSMLYIPFCSIKKDKFFFISMTGNSYGDNVKPLSDYLYAHYPDAEIVWAFSKQFKHKGECPHKRTDLYTFRYYYHILTSRFIISNARLNGRMLHKRRGQVYLQTWHGTALKKLGVDIETKRNVFQRIIRPSVFHRDVDNTDIMISGNTFMSGVFREKFLFKGDIWEVGTPRNDIFFHSHPEIKEKILRKYNISEDAQIILYAPTFRNDREFTYYDFDYKTFCDLWNKRTGKSSVFLVRLHPILLYKSDELKNVFGKDTINVSDYPDMQELLYATDVLVTDYSSSMFDIMLMHKPVVLYTPDADSYSNGYYFDFGELPFYRVKNNNELKDLLNNLDICTYRSKILGFLNKLGNKEDGNACDTIVRKLLTKE